MKTDHQRIMEWLCSHGYSWSESKNQWIDSQPGGFSTEDVIGALDAAHGWFTSKGQDLKKPLAYVFTTNREGMSMVTRQMHRRMDKVVKAENDEIPAFTPSGMAIVSELAARFGVQA